MATPTDPRDYEVYLRGPVGLDTFAFGTVDAYRGGMQHHGLMSMFPAPSENAVTDFGIMQGGGFTVEIADEGELDWFLLWEDGSYILWTDQTRIISEY